MENSKAGGKMSKDIAQLVDSAGNLPREIIRKYKIKELPFYYTLDGQNYYLENVDLDTADFYHHMQEYPDRIPKTAAPNVNDWLSGFEELYKQGYKKYIATTISSHLSAAFQNASMACKIFQDSHSDTKVEVINSQTCTCGQAALEIKIARMINEGQLAFEEIVNYVESILPDLTTLFSVESLRYMKAGGRIGGAAAWLGRMVNIKPVCEFRNGVVKPVKAVRGRKKSLTQMVDIVVNRVKDLNSCTFCVQSALSEEDENFIIEQLRLKLGYQGNIYRGILGACIGAHSGPGSIGIGFVE